jgi:phage-related protein
MSGFTYRGVHCEELGCIHIPDAAGNWFQSPEFDVAKDEVNWRDGSYYYYTRRKARTFSLNCYFEEITMKERERIRRWLDAKASGDLIFDDREYLKYKVRPSKVITGKIYEQQSGLEVEPKYSGTFTITFEAQDPYGYLTRMTLDDLVLTDYDGLCNLIRSDMMPAAPSSPFTSFDIYNPGTAECGVTLRITGTAPNGLTITNTTNNTVCVLRGLPSDATLIIDSETGLVQAQGSGSPEIAFVYHDHGYITLTPNDGLNFTCHCEYTSRSQNATVILDIPEDLTGSYLYIGGTWKKINSHNMDTGAIQLSASAGATGNSEVHIAKMNKIAITGTNVSLSGLSYSFTPRAL